MKRCKHCKTYFSYDIVNFPVCTECSQALIYTLNCCENCIVRIHNEEFHLPVSFI